MFFPPPKPPLPTYDAYATASEGGSWGACPSVSLRKADVNFGEAELALGLPLPSRLEKSAVAAVSGAATDTSSSGLQPPLLPPCEPRFALLGPPGCCEGAIGADAAGHAARARASHVHALWAGHRGMVRGGASFPCAWGEKNLSFSRFFQSLLS